MRPSRNSGEGRRIATRDYKGQAGLAPDGMCKYMVKLLLKFDFMQIPGRQGATMQKAD